MTIDAHDQPPTSPSSLPREEGEAAGGACADRGGAPAAGRPRHRLHRPRQWRRRRGFSFVEVLFAVMILGIGFIMIAGIFPVTLTQVQVTSEETSAAAVARGATAILSRVLTSDELQPTGGFQSLSRAAPEAWDRVKADLIVAADPRYAWTPLVRRLQGNNFAQVVLIVLRARNRPTYDPRVDLNRQPDPGVSSPATFEPRLFRAVLKDGGADPDTIVFGGDVDEEEGALGPGAIVVIADDGRTGDGNGRTYRLGNQRNAASRTWDLLPGNDLRDASEELDNARVLLIGRGYAEPANPPAGYAGPVQDIAVYSTFIPLP